MTHHERDQITNTEWKLAPLEEHPGVMVAELWTTGPAPKLIGRAHPAQDGFNFISPYLVPGRPDQIVLLRGGMSVLLDIR